jgi:hypothetical protein
MNHRTITRLLGVALTVLLTLGLAGAAEATMRGLATKKFDPEYAQSNTFTLKADWACTGGRVPGANIQKAIRLTSRRPQTNGYSNVTIWFRDNANGHLLAKMSRKHWARGETNRAPKAARVRGVGKDVRITVEALVNSTTYPKGNRWMGLKGVAHC